MKERLNFHSKSNNHKVYGMANSPPLVLKISSNLEIPQSNRKNFPTENESNSMTERRDGKQSESVSKNDPATETPGKGERNVFHYRYIKPQSNEDV